MFQRRCFTVIELLMKMSFFRQYVDIFCLQKKKQSEREREREGDDRENICAFNLRRSPSNKLSAT